MVRSGPQPTVETKTRPVSAKLQINPGSTNMFLNILIIFLHRKAKGGRPTATRYLNGLVETGLIDKVRIGRSYYYMNLPLMDLFLSVSDSKVTENVPPIESVLDSI